MIFFITSAAAIACIVVTIMSAKRIGGIAPWLIAAMCAIDMFLGAVYRIYRLLSETPRFEDSTYTLLMLFEALSTYVMGLLVLVACFLLMPRLRRA